MSDLNSKSKSKKSTQKTKPKRNHRAIIIISILGVVILWLGCWALSLWIIDEPSMIDTFAIRGQFGDMFGAVNALFSGLAFAGIIYTIYLQQIDSAESKHDIAKQQRQIERQNAILVRQRFETTFFNMLNAHFNIIKEVKQYGYVPEKNANYWTTGLDAFRMFHAGAVKATLGLNRTSIHQMPNDFYEYARVHNWYYASYQNSMIALYRLIKNSKFKPKAEERYIKILNAYISLEEMIFWSYQAVLSSPSHPEIISFEKDFVIVETLKEANLLPSTLLLYINTIKANQS